MRWVKTDYLDASALVKLVIDEENHHHIRTYFDQHANFCATSLCLMEALGVIKGKWTSNRISEDQYFCSTQGIILKAWGGKIEIDPVNLFHPESLEAVQVLARKHTLDLSDALQLQTILKGKYSASGPNSASTLITADEKLATAAEAEGIRSWNCIRTPAPSWD